MSDCNFILCNDIVVRMNAVQHSMKVRNLQFKVSRKGLRNRCPHSEREIVAPQKLGPPATRSVELVVRKLFLYSFQGIGTEKTDCDWQLLLPSL